MKMKFKKTAILTFVLMSVLCLNAQTEKEFKKLFVVEGRFFNEMPVSKDAVSGFYILKAPNGSMALGVTLKIPLTEDMFKYSIPKEQVTEGDELLERFNEAVKKKTAGMFQVQSKDNILKVGNKFPDFSATDINGKTWTKADVEGKVMVLNLWFTGCAPCRAEMPELSKWKDEMPDVMFFSSTYETAERAKPVLEKQGFNWINIVDDDEFVKYVGNNGYPINVIVDKNGYVAMVEYGTSTILRNEMKNKIQSLR